MLRHAPLGGDLDGVTRFRDQTITITHGLDAAEWRSTLVHELRHLVRGPVPPELAAAEEMIVQHETAALLVPTPPTLGRHALDWDPAEVQEMAARHGVDDDVMWTAISPPTIPLPRQPSE